MNQFDSNLTKSLEDFMENYKMIDVEQIYSNGTEFVPIFRVKQWLEYNNINNLQSKIDKAIEILGQYKHLSSPTEEQANEQEEIVSNAYDILKEDK